MHNIKVICNQDPRAVPILQDGEHQLILREEKQKWSQETCVLRVSVITSYSSWRDCLFWTCIIGNGANVKNLACVLVRGGKPESYMQSEFSVNVHESNKFSLNWRKTHSPPIESNMIKGSQATQVEQQQ